MDTYEWQKNFAIVNRMYYTGRLWETTIFVAAVYTASNMMFIRKGYFAPIMRQRLLPIWGKLAGFNSAVTFILLAPLQRDEMAVQMKKRLIMGKFLYSTFHLDPEQQKFSTDIRLV